MEFIAVISIVAGILLVGLFLADIVGTVLVPTGGPGILSRRLYWILWGVWRSISKFAGSRQRAFLSKGEALLMVSTVAMWVLLLIVGFALIFLPFANLFIPSTIEWTSTEFLSVLYVSAYSATTLGVGDLYPSTGPLRLLLTIEALLGFSALTASISYLLSVGSAILSTSSISNSITQYIALGEPEGNSIDKALERTTTVNGQKQTIQWLAGVEPQLAAATQTGKQYPLIQYFHSPSNQSALPVALEMLLEYLTVWRTLVKSSAGCPLTDSPLVETCYVSACGILSQGAQQMRHSINADVMPQNSLDDDFNRHYQILKTAGIPVHSKKEARELYMKARWQWKEDIRTITECMKYPNVSSAV